jgi:hypothetical protein
VSQRITPDQAMRRAQEMILDVAEAMGDGATDAVRAARAYLATEQGRRMRHRVAQALILGAPVISELPVLRRTPIGRALRLVGIGGLMVKGAEWLRDWEPTIVTVGEPRR